MKPLTQAVFDLPHCPPEVISASVGADGYAWGFNVLEDNLKLSEVGHHTYVIGATAWCLGSGYDTTDWQNSAINRGK